MAVAFLMKDGVAVKKRVLTYLVLTFIGSIQNTVRIQKSYIKINA